MAKLKITELTKTTYANPSDLLYIVQANASKSIAVNDLLRNVSNLSLSGNVSFGGVPQVINGTGTVAIRGSGNVSSITDNGTGDYTVKFTTAMPDANYGYALSGSQVGSDSSNLNPLDGGFATSSLRIGTFNLDAAPAARDYDLVSVSIFR